MVVGQIENKNNSKKQEELWETIVGRNPSIKIGGEEK